jgi:hypothetical protein
VNLRHGYILAILEKSKKGVTGKEYLMLIHLIGFIFALVHCTPLPIEFNATLNSVNPYLLGHLPRRMPSDGIVVWRRRGGSTSADCYIAWPDYVDLPDPSACYPKLCYAHSPDHLCPLWQLPSGRECKWGGKPE